MEPWAFMKKSPQQEEEQEKQQEARRRSGDMGSVPDLKTLG